jgi:vacuolar-type H+-ATPase subunit C/Vma6
MGMMNSEAKPPMFLLDDALIESGWPHLSSELVLDKTMKGQVMFILFTPEYGYVEKWIKTEINDYSIIPICTGLDVIRIIGATDCTHALLRWG